MQFSILITAYNPDHNHLASAIASAEVAINAIGEFGGGAEILVRDDGSKSSIREIVGGSRHALLVTGENIGIEKSLLELAGLAKGKWVIRLDSDDLFDPELLVKCLPYTDGLGNYDFFYSDYHVIDNSGEHIRTVNLPKFSSSEIRMRGDFLATGMMVLRDSFLEYFGSSGKYFSNCGIENYLFVLWLIDCGGRGFHEDTSLFSYRRHPQNISSMRMNEIRIFAERHFAATRGTMYRWNRFHPYLD